MGVSVNVPGLSIQVGNPGWGVAIGTPYYGQPAPVYYEPAPAYRPAPVYYERPVYYAPPVRYVTPRPVVCLLYTSPSPRDRTRSRMPSSA